MLKVRNPLRNKFTGGQTNGTLSFNARARNYNPNSRPLEYTFVHACAKTKAKQGE
jgi:hypothetical protein